MALKTRTILDSDNGIYSESLDIEEVFQSPAGAIPFRITKRRLHGGIRDGVDIIEVDNGKFCFTIIPTRGMNMWKGRCGDVQLKWDSAVRGPVHPKFVSLNDPSGCGWLDGFDEFIARCGLESLGSSEFDQNGVLKYGLHGRISNLPARRVKVSFNTETGEIIIKGVIEEARALQKRLALYVTYSTFAGSSKLTVHDMVKNRSSVATDFELMYHINAGEPFVSAGAKVMVPFEEMCPRDNNAVEQLPDWNIYQEPLPGRPECCFFFDLAVDRNKNTKVLLINSQGTRGLTLGFNKEQFPHFLVWKMQRPCGDSYVTGLEPGLNFPNTKSFEKEKGRVQILEPGETRSFEFSLEVLHNFGEISETIHYIKRLQSNASGKILKAPKPDWCE
ncbi:MAG: aldose 1-epimerase family protein [Planctomycetia bacterium]|nr:aldose 1-epimerase family protein [Planctomycetia bacterium]